MQLEAGGDFYYRGKVEKSEKSEEQKKLEWHFCFCLFIFNKNTTKRTAMKSSFSLYPMFTSYFQVWVQDFKVKVKHPNNF